MSRVKVAQGRRGEIRLETKDNKKIATKKALSEEMRGPLLKEGRILQHLNDHDIGFVPQIISIHNDGFSYERIEGRHFEDVYQESNLSGKKNLLIKLLECAYALDKVGVIHGELLRPFTNVLVNDDGVVSLIDFERGKFGDTSGKNMKHVMQRLNNQGYLDVKKLRKISSYSLDDMKYSLTQVIKSKNQGSSSESFGIQSLATLAKEGLGESLRYGLGNIIRLFVFCCCLIGLDQLTKSWIVDTGNYIESSWITPSINTGIAWSIPVPKLWILILSIVLLLGVFLYRIFETNIHRRLQRVGTDVALFKIGIVGVISGGIGNLIDRLWLGGVRDFIDVSPLITFYDRPIFNLADTYIVVGVICLLLYEAFNE